ncbi:matrixin family metalloprotease [bacterium]|nr:matrixin family metalloprotease [bacterium]
MNKKLIFCSILVIICALVYRFLPNYFYVQGKLNFNRKNYEKAYNYFTKAHSIYKNDKDYRYYYVQTMLKMKPTKEIQQELFKISTDSKDDSAHASAKRQVNRWKYGVLQNIGNNYIEQVPIDKKIMRWSSFPIKYTIINSTGEVLPDYYRREILRALGQWQSSTGFLKFAETTDKSNADIIYEINKLPDNVCEGNACRFVLGFTTSDYKGKILNNMKVILYDKDPFGRYFPDKDLFNTVLHETGHALGIMGHSYNEDDIMYMSAEQENIYTAHRSYFQYLSSNDINTITLLYKLIPDITDTDEIDTEGLVYAPIILGTEEEISNRKVKEAKNYIKNAPELAGGYIDLGIAYSELKRTDEALEAMHKAYSLSKTDNEKYASLYNLALIYMNTGDTRKAKEYALKAKQISDTEEIRKLILSIK